MTIDADTIAVSRAVRIEDEIGRRGIKLRGKVERVGPCPVCGGADRFAINTRKQAFNCRGSRAGGGVIDMVMHLDGCTFAEAIHTLAGIRPGRPALVIDPAKMAAVKVKAERDEIERIRDEAERIVRAMDIWDDARLIETTPAEVYLRIHRRVEIPPGPPGSVLRFHPACPFGDARHPCLIALVRNIVTDEPQAIVRTALNPDGTALKINGKTARKALGPIGEGAIKLSDHTEITTCLGVGEGVESVLSMRQTPEFGSPVWSLISDSGLANFPVLAGIECLWIAVDNDRPDQHGRQAGVEAAFACSRRWTSSGRRVLRLTPHQVGCDLNDCILDRAAS
jgi:Toprim domain/CHC2 zinc finger